MKINAEKMIVYCFMLISIKILNFFEILYAFKKNLEMVITKLHYGAINKPREYFKRERFYDCPRFRHSRFLSVWTLLTHLTIDRNRMFTKNLKMRLTRHHDKRLYFLL